MTNEPSDPDRLTTLTRLALELHEGQVDGSGVAYGEHILAVTDSVSAAAKPVALFHDSLEDGKATRDQLAELLSPEELAAVELVSRDKNAISYEDFIEAIRVAPGRAGELAREVKLSDLRHNHGRLTPELERLRSRYEAAIKTLTSATDSHAG